MGELKSAACRPACAPTMACPSPRPTLCSTSPSSRWLRLGITIERIQPGHPQQNGRHERMHLTLKTETTRPAGLNSLQQQTKFDDFLEEFNPRHESARSLSSAFVHQAVLLRPMHSNLLGVESVGVRRTSPEVEQDRHGPRLRITPNVHIVA